MINSIDIRMLSCSGIGTYIKNLLPFIFEKFQEDIFYLIGNKVEILRIGFDKYPNVRVVDFASPIYSLKEQVDISNNILKNTNIFWSPHYNIPLRFNGKLLVTIHDVNHLALPHLLGGFHKRLYAKFMFNAVKKKSSQIITVSEFSKREIIKCVGIKAEKISVVYNGVESFWFHVKMDERPHPKKYFLYVGNVKPHKNLCALLQAFDLLKNNIDHDVVIVGQKHGFITQDKKIDHIAQKMMDRVHFTGYLSDSLLNQWVAHAEALVFPSLYEGFGLPPLEAMACGCPVLCSNAASLPEVCGDAALYFDPYQPKDIANKMEMLINNPSLRNELVEKGRSRARQFTWEKSAQQVINIINSLKN
jgi:glycosyltransferase involved in cell wall biosynthesis